MFKINRNQLALCASEIAAPAKSEVAVMDSDARLYAPAAQESAIATTPADQVIASCPLRARIYPFSL